MSIIGGTSPFRDDAEQLREQLRRADEVATELAEKNTVLERDLMKQTRAHRWLAALVLSSLFFGGLGFGLGGSNASRQAAVVRSDLELQMSFEKRVAQANRDRCSADLAKSNDDLTTCQLQIASMRPRMIDGYVPPVQHPMGSSCTCQAGDPLCSCPNTGPTTTAKEFDRGAAAGMLGSLTGAVSMCMTSHRPINMHVKILFEPSGHVSQANVDSLSDGSLSAPERECITHVVMARSIPAFDGSPVTVGKSYNVGASP